VNASLTSGVDKRLFDANDMSTFALSPLDANRQRAPNGGKSRARGPGLENTL